MLLTQSVEAGIAFHAFVAIDGGAFDRRVDVDGAHRTNVGAVAAGDAFVGIDLHALAPILRPGDAETPAGKSG